ncbi:MAG: 3-oxoacyl-[acyl-carrier protein] reductase [Frankiales bacterium]|jgi:3-oxoacyl-[acyl-carrier protein] reductase|nr:3-oxoacyl-[acyl-carrier protein] reductase [Frankiales bacterium]
MDLFEHGAVIITGAGKGIGRATALTAAQEGLAVAAWDRDSVALDELVSVIGAAGGTAKGFVVDVGDSSAVETALDASFAFGDCRYLVNNAGPLSRPTSPMTFEDGLVLAMGSVYQVTTGWLKRAGDDAESVVSLSSISGTTWAGGASDIYYPVAKSAIAAYMKEIAVRHRGRPRANAVAPGGTITARTQDHINTPGSLEQFARSPLGRPAEAQEIADVICFLLSPRASHVNGVVLPVDGGYAIT